MRTFTNCNVLVIGDSFYHMNLLYERFNSITLPYEYVVLPKANEAKSTKIPGLFYFVNRVITGLTQQAFQRGGFTRSSKISKWNASWGRQFEKPQYLNCQQWQKVNHFAGAFLMGRKDKFHQRITELKERCPEITSFYPESYLLPQEKERFAQIFFNKKMWIFKPSASARGCGIKLFDSSSKEAVPTQTGIYQVYIEKPFLITQRKFDLRLYALITSVNPIRIYLHENGLARFATHEYTDGTNTKDLRMHLTNYSMNKDDGNFILSSGKELLQNSKWSLQFFMKYLDEQGIDTLSLLKRIEQAIVAALIAGLCAVREYHFTCIPHRHTSYELYGVDVILDENLNPYIMEINISPSMEATGSKFDKDIKLPLLLDTLNMARIIKCNSGIKNPCPGLAKIDRLFNESMTQERVSSVVNDGINPWESPVFADFVFIRDFLEESFCQTKFRRVFPKRKTMKLFDKCFDKKLYSDIVFEKWIELDNEHRIEVIGKSWNIYEDRMNLIQSLDENAPNEEQIETPKSVDTTKEIIDDL